MHINACGSQADKERMTRNALLSGLLDTVVTLGVLLAWLLLRCIVLGRNEAFDFGPGKLESLSSVFVGERKVGAVQAFLDRLRHAVEARIAHCRVIVSLTRERVA